MNLKEFLPFHHHFRPKNLEEFIGQEELLKQNGLIASMINQQYFIHSIFCGPPGTGKTTLARIIGNLLNAKFFELNAAFHTTKDLHKIVNSINEKAIIFIDEIHRFSKTQQDALLPYLETNKFILLGATTENPSFYLIPPLLSRTKIFTFKPILKNHVKRLLTNIIKKLEENNIEINNKDFYLENIPNLIPNDLRKALNVLELAIISNVSSLEQLKEIANSYIYYSKDGDDKYELLSAIQKSIRSSDVDAALLYTMKLIKSGEDPKTIFRRLFVIASEDIGNSDPQAIQILNSTFNAFNVVGMPEGIYNLFQCVIYLSLAPKSNSTKIAIERIEKISLNNIQIPNYLKNAPTKLMKELGYKKGYKYDHDYPYSISDQQCLPENLRNQTFYTPKKHGFEKILAKRLEFIKKIKGYDLK